MQAVSLAREPRSGRDSLRRHWPSAQWFSPCGAVSLGTVTLNEVALPEAPEHSFPLQTRATPVQQRALDLLGVDPARFVASNVAV